jgi:Fe-S oxidoreductase
VTRHERPVDDLDSVLRAVAPEAEIPAEAACCGMAGDKGWSNPGLTRAATRRARRARSSSAN